ncbi:MAG TPA: APC family permease [Candidatus Limnocylindrales bacterium]|jgi:amino acid transporter|nr:APC family permease [Candidatus Limnocylindrales bacterium]
MIGGRRPLQGRKVGDKRVRVERPHAPFFRYTGKGQLTAKEAASVPTTPGAKLIAKVRGFVLGRPLASEEEAGERLSKKKALAIFSSDAISSSAYATEEILRAFVLAGAALAAFDYAIEVSIAIALLLGIVAFSYRQVCIAYPNGGGSYSVSKANIGRIASLVAASALLIDYNLTVAVSTSSAVEQIASAVPALAPVSVAIGVVAIGLITVGNLRGLREAGNIFAVPTYLFLGSAFLMIGIGVFRIVVLGDTRAPSPEALAAVSDTTRSVGILVLLRAFASGAVALTGTEAIATGVPAFKPPEAKNAATTLMVMAGVLGVLFVGITFLATNFGILPIDGPVKQTVVAQVASVVFGGDSIGFYLFQAFTALLLFLAANTCFAAFPRLAAVLAIDGFFPRQFSFRGDRLAYSMGIVALGLIAASLVVIFKGETHALIPLYAVGVFIDFTIAQFGMIRHWLRARSPGWRRRLAINAIGCVATAIVAVVVTTIKFRDGAYLVLLLIPILVSIMLFIRREYDGQARELHVRDDIVIDKPHREQRVVVPVNGINRAVVQAVMFGRTMSRDIRAVFVTEDPDEGEAMRERWERQIPGVPLVIVESPFRAVVSPVLAYLDVLDQAWPPDRPAPITIVVLPEYVARHWWDRLLYNQTAKRMKAAILGREHTVIADVPYRRQQ